MQEKASQRDMVAWNDEKSIIRDNTHTERDTQTSIRINWCFTFVQCVPFTEGGEGEGG